MNKNWIFFSNEHNFIKIPKIENCRIRFFKKSMKSLVLIFKKHWKRMRLTFKWYCCLLLLVLKNSRNHRAEFFSSMTSKMINLFKIEKYWYDLEANFSIFQTNHCKKYSTFLLFQEILKNYLFLWGFDCFPSFFLDSIEVYKALKNKRNFKVCFLKIFVQIFFYTKRLKKNYPKSTHSFQAQEYFTRKTTQYCFKRGLKTPPKKGWIFIFAISCRHHKSS